MSKIKIRNFGPILDGLKENDGWVDINKVTVFIGNQGSGKSTIAKLISTFTWIEKALVRGDYNRRWFQQEDTFRKRLLKYHRIDDYFGLDGLYEKTEIDFIGDAYRISYKNGSLRIQEASNGNYPLPQIMYVPAERNFISYVSSPKELKLSSDSLKEFLTEFDNAKNDLDIAQTLPINETSIEYDRSQNMMRIGGPAYKLKLSDASSGIQSLVPVYLVSKYLSHSVKKMSESKESMSSDELSRFKKGVSDIWSNDDLTDEQKRAAISAISTKFNKTAFINIVEELEQNLFPESQWELLKSLLEFNNYSSGNKLILTTHSPYIVTYLSISIQASYLKGEIGGNMDIMKKLDSVVPQKSMIDTKDVSIYQLNEKDGSIMKLEKFEGIPSDRNFLNSSLAEGNRLFDKLLEIEQEL